eukprot:CAMPEP_0180355170 /NCGR_PEP_ID=MMETSP0989-20121125/8625_1 /TAXON_ID=697907 /ORGANISM="non described non described, Strain CCMP2293" /LENGTH=94 /DNA_ID=CAMNT_0022345073 /DNA_START=112 /DNA_END=393 /DNA_ORIENTATION=+
MTSLAEHVELGPPVAAFIDMLTTRPVAYVIRTRLSQKWWSLSLKVVVAHDLLGGGHVELLRVLVLGQLVVEEEGEHPFGFGGPLATPQKRFRFP